MLPWVLLVYGATLALTGSRLTRPFRDALCRRWPAAGRFISCPMCVGWWCGAASWFVFPELCPVQAHCWYLAAPANGFCALAACWAIHVVLARLGAEEL